MPETPLATVVCLCYNQKDYIEEAIQSVLNQTYKNLELIVVDDASSDGSKELIKNLTRQLAIPFIDLQENIGNCAAFNLGFLKSKGSYIIDLAGDDVLLPHRVEVGISDFLASDEETGVHFSDALMINSLGEILGTHYQRNENGQLVRLPPSGNIYENLIQRYFICPPTMMIKREVLEDLKGYDESLSYEDFDFWVRSSRKFKYVFNENILVKKRILRHGHASTQSKFRNKHLNSTFRVCEKIHEMNRTPSEDKALIDRINYEIRQSIKTFNVHLILKYMKLKNAVYRRLSSPSSMER